MTYRSRCEGFVGFIMMVGLVSFLSCLCCQVLDELATYGPTWPALVT